MAELEHWRRIKDFPDYLVSDIGRVMSLKGEQPLILKPGRGDGRYYQVILMREDRKFTRRVHRLVAEAFIEQPEGKRYVDHLNGDSYDNRVENLRWCTARENRRNPITANRTLLAIHRHWESHRKGNLRRFKVFCPGEIVSGNGMYQFNISN